MKSQRRCASCDFKASSSAVSCQNCGVELDHNEYFVESKSGFLRVAWVSLAAMGLVSAGAYGVFVFGQFNQVHFNPGDYTLTFSASTIDGKMSDPIPPVLTGGALNLSANVEALSGALPYVLRIQKSNNKKNWVTISALDSSASASSQPLKYEFDSPGDTFFRAGIFENSSDSEPRLVSKPLAVATVDAEPLISNFIYDFNAAWDSGVESGAKFLKDNVYPGLYNTKSDIWKTDTQNLIDGNDWWHMVPEWDTMKADYSYVPPDTFCSAHQSKPLPGVIVKLKVEYSNVNNYNSDTYSYTDYQEFVILDNKVKIFSFINCGEGGGY